MDEEILGLGAKQYWDQFYEEELANYNNHGDIGDSWFGKRCVQKMIDWIEVNIYKKSFICDIGCGNGVILSELQSRGFRHLYGVDFSDKAIEFCNAKYGNTKPSSYINFKVGDILGSSALFDHKFNLIIDKGTYDAISLSPQEEIHLKQKKYVQFLENNLEEESHFIIFTCNFTKEEMIFILEEANLYLIHEFDSPIYSFNNQRGKPYTGLVFKMPKRR